jgi:hypothetical protein
MPIRQRLTHVSVATTLAFLTAASDAVGLDDLFLGFDHHARVLGVDIRDLAGISAAAGDVSGDGIGDLVIGVPQSDGNANAERTAGEAAIVFGGPGLTGDVDLLGAPVTFFGATDSSNLGYAVAAADVDGDGIDDVILGAPKADGRQAAAGGAVYVFYGGARLPLGDVRLADVTMNIVLFGAHEGRFGVSLVTGDFNADGYADIVIGAPREGRQFGRPLSGVVYIYYGHPPQSNFVELTLNTRGEPAFRVTTILGPSIGAFAGRGLAAGDVNGDGVDDLLVGSTVPPDEPVRRPASKPLSGVAHVLFGGGNGVLLPRGTSPLEVDLASPTQVDVTIRGPLPGDSFALALGVANINGDGAGDILIGAPTSPFSPGLDTGRAYAIFGRRFPSGTVKDLALETADVTLTGPHDDALFGATITGGDMNGDGFDEWVVGAPRADTTGQAYRFLGRAQWPRPGVFGSLTQGHNRGDRAGTALAMADVSGDGLFDLAVSSPEYDGLLGRDARNSGAVFTVLGVPGPDTPNPPCIDADGDGVNANGRTCGPKDCDDTDPTIGACNPSQCEGLPDDDHDGWPRFADSLCIVADCDDLNATINPGMEEDCTDGFDNDCDGAIDGIDTECGGTGQCEVTEPGPEVCDDGIDNDCDGLRDAADPDCRIGPGAEDCTNCFDDDLDGKIDLSDPDCASAPFNLKSAVLERTEKKATTIKKLRLKTVLPDGALLTDGAVAGGSAAGIVVDQVTSSVAFGVSFNGQQELCVALGIVGKGKKKVVVYRSNRQSGPAAKLKVKQAGAGQLKLKYNQKGGIELPDATPAEMAVGFYSPSQPYRVVTPLKKKGGTKIVPARTKQN